MGECERADVDACVSGVNSFVLENLPDKTLHKTTEEVRLTALTALRARACCAALLRFILFP